MKVFVFVLLLLTIGDIVFDHGAIVMQVGHAGNAFAHGVARAFSESLFAA